MKTLSFLSIVSVLLFSCVEPSSHTKKVVVKEIDSPRVLIKYVDTCYRVGDTISLPHTSKKTIQNVVIIRE